MIWGGGGVIQKNIFEGRYVTKTGELGGGGHTICE